MKKIAFLLICAMLSGMAVAREASMILGAVNETLAAPTRATEVGDTIVMQPTYIFCAYCPNRNTNGMYYFQMEMFAAYPDPTPQVQIHFLSSDTLSITKTLDMQGVVYYPTVDENSKVYGTQGSKAAIKFIDYVEVNGDPYARYQIVFDIILTDGRRIMGSYDNIVFFYYQGTNEFFLPSNEGFEDALEAIAPDAQTEKVMIDGRLYIRRGNALYDLRGNRL